MGLAQRPGLWAKLWPKPDLHDACTTMLKAVINATMQFPMCIHKILVMTACNHSLIVEMCFSLIGVELEIGVRETLISQSLADHFIFRICDTET